MKRLTMLVLALAGTLAVPSLASAKELTKAQVCGPGGCATVTDKHTLLNIPTGGDTPSAPPPASSYYELRLTVTERSHTYRWTSYYVPASNMVAGIDEYNAGVFFRIYGDAGPLMRRLSRGIAPFPKPHLTSVTVGSAKVAKNLDSYLLLYGIKAAGQAHLQDVDWVPISLTSKRVTPWTVGGNTLAYSPSAKLLQRGSEFVRLPDGIADDVASARAIDPSPGRSLLPWLVLAALALAIGAFAAVGVVFARRRVAQSPARPSVA